MIIPPKKTWVEDDMEFITAYTVEGADLEGALIASGHNPSGRNKRSGSFIKDYEVNGAFLRVYK